MKQAENKADCSPTMYRSRDGNGEEMNHWSDELIPRLILDQESNEG